MIEKLSGTKGVHKNTTSRVQEKTMEEPKDSTVIVSKNAIEASEELSAEDIKAIRKEMKKEGYIFNDKGLAPAIIYPSSEAKLIAGQEIVSGFLGEIITTLWQVEAFTANIPPEAYHFFSKNESHFTVVPDTEFRTLKKAKLKFGLIALCDSIDQMK